MNASKSPASARSERIAVLLEGGPGPLFAEIAKLVDPATGVYSFPAHKAFDDYKKIHADGFRGDGQVVAIVDTGIDETHPLLRDSIIEAADFTDEGTTNDLHGHGTLVALIIRYCAPGAKLINAKAFGKSGSTRESVLAAALKWLHAKKPDVVNLSAGIPSKDPAAPFAKAFPDYFSAKKRDHWLVSSLRRHWPAPCPVCAAADKLVSARANVCTAVGNSKDEIMCPGRSGGRGLIVVGAATVGEAAAVPEYSALWPTLVAPELPIAEGTSFSAPFVSGTCALLRSVLVARAEGEARSEQNLKQGSVLFQRGDFAGAIAHLEEGLAYDRHLSQHASQGGATKSCLICQSIIYAPRVQLGMSYLQLGDPRAAAAVFEQNVVIAPRFPDVYMNYGAALREAGDLDGAIAAFKQALSLNPRKAAAYEGLGDAYVLAGALSEAAQAFERAIALDASLPYPLQRLAHISDLVGDAAAARALRERARQLT
jgi:subtilisin family serine protease